MVAKSICRPQKTQADLKVNARDGFRASRWRPLWLAFRHKKGGSLEKRRPIGGLRWWLRGEGEVFHSPCTNRVKSPNQSKPPISKRKVADKPSQVLQVSFGLISHRHIYMCVFACLFVLFVCLCLCALVFAFVCLCFRLFLCV